MVIKIDFFLGILLVAIRYTLKSLKRIHPCVLRNYVTFVLYCATHTAAVQWSPLNRVTSGPRTFDPL